MADDQIEYLIEDDQIIEIIEHLCRGIECVIPYNPDLLESCKSAIACKDEAMRWILSYIRSITGREQA